MQDCGALWQRFQAEKCIESIQGKLDAKVYAVYHNYDGDHTGPYEFFIGCAVDSEAKVPDGMVSIEIPAQDYQLRLAKGQMPNCIAEAWMEIWDSDIDRAYTYDFEVYGEKSYDWTNAEVEIFLALNS